MSYYWMAQSVDTIISTTTIDIDDVVVTVEFIGSPAYKKLSCGDLYMHYIDYSMDDARAHFRNYLRYNSII